MTQFHPGHIPCHMIKPVLKIVSGPSPTQKGLFDASLSGTSTLFSALSKAVDLQPHDNAGLYQILTFRRAVAQQASRRSRWFGGRMYNTYLGEDPDYISLSGTHLKQTLSACGLNAPEFVIPSGAYQLRLDYVEGAIDALFQKLNS